METRRDALAVLAGACTTALAGCALLEDVLEAEAEPAGVEEKAVAETPFEHDRLSEDVHEQTVEVGGESQDLRLTNWTNRYTMAVPEVDLEAARFSLFTTPTVTVADRSANPFRRLDREELVRAVVDRLDTGPIEEIEKTGERSVTVLGNRVTVDEFDARTQQEGIDLRLHMGDRTHDGDLLVPFALHPELLDLTEEVDTLAEGTAHPVDRP